MAFSILIWEEKRQPTLTNMLSNPGEFTMETLSILGWEAHYQIKQQTPLLQINIIVNHTCNAPKALKRMLQNLQKQTPCSHIKHILSRKIQSLISCYSTYFQ